MIENEKTTPKGKITDEMLKDKGGRLEIL